MDRKLLDSFAELLRKQRKEYLYEFRKAEADLDSISEERESELEEHAQEEQSARLLTRMDDRTLHAVQEIDAALQRLLKGTYGSCQACGGTHTDRPPSDSAGDPVLYRLRSAARERDPDLARRAETPSTASVPGDLSLLDDSELAEVIRQHLKEDGRIDTEELRIVCRKGVVHLSGALPSEAEHQIVLQIVTDVLGLKEVVDRIQVEELLWERESRTKEKPPEVLPPGQEPPLNHRPRRSEAKA